MAVDAVDLRRLPLDSLAGELEALTDESVRIQPVGFRSVINLRGDASDDGFMTAMDETLSVKLPSAANRWTGDDRRAAIWLGPDEWLIVGPDGEAAAVEEAIRKARPEDPWLSVVDVSHNYTALLLSGMGVRELLAKGCPLDLHPRAFGAHDCAQTILARTRVLLRAMDDQRSIEVWVRNSFAGYMARWLLDASAELRER